MGCEILIVAKAKFGLTTKGMIFSVRDLPCEWGKQEGPPNWIRVIITDGSVELANQYVRVNKTVDTSESTAEWLTEADRIDHQEKIKTIRKYRIPGTLVDDILKDGGIVRMTLADFQSHVIEFS